MRKSVGDVASTSTSGAHLRKRLTGALYESDVRGGGDFAKRDGKEKARSTSADDLDVRH